MVAACSSGSRRPAIRSVELPEAPSGDVEMAVTLATETSELVSIAIEISTDELVWNPATTTVGTLLSSLATTPTGVRHVFTWDSLADLGFRIEGDTWIKITASGDGGLVDIQTAKLNRIANLLPAAKRVRNHMIYFGALDAAKIAVAKTHDLVILNPCDPSVTKSAIASIQKGVNALDPRDDCIVLGYLNVGEDDRTIGRSDAQLLADPRFVGTGTGPRVDPRGPGAAGQSLAGIDLNGAASASGGFASFYLDDNSVETNGVGDGLPDRNALTGACYTNVGDPLWFATLHDMRCAQDGIAGVREMLTTSYGAGLACDGLFLDNVDTCAPDAYTQPGDPDHASFEWTAPGMPYLLGELRRRYPDAVLMQNRGLFFFDPRQPHYQFTTGPLIDFLLLESYRLDRETGQAFDPYVFADNKYNFVPRLQAEAQRFTFQILSLGYAAGPGIDPATLLGTSTAGYQTLLTDVQEAELVGFRHYLTNSAGDLVNSFARDHGTSTDTTPPVWSSTYNAYGLYNPPGAPVARVGIQQVVATPGELTVRWDVALDQNPVTYHLYYSRNPITFDSNGFPRNTEYQELLPARVPTNYAAGTLLGSYPFEATSTSLTRNKLYYFCIFARDSVGNWAKNTVVLSAVTQ